MTTRAAGRATGSGPSRAARYTLFAAGVLAAAIGIFIALFDWNWLKRPIERVLSDTTGRTLVVGGNVSGNWSWDWRPQLRLESVRLSNPEWATDPQLLQARAVEFRLRLLPLLSRRVHLDTLSFESPHLSLERAKDGRATWYFDHEQNDASASPVIEWLSVDQGSVRYRSAADATDFEAKLQEDPTAAARRALAFTGAGKLRGLPFRVNGATASLLVLRKLDQPLPLEASGAVAETRFRLVGMIEGLQRFEKADLRYTLEGPTLKTLGLVFDAPLPNTPPYRISGLLHHSAGLWASDDLHGRIGRSDVAGRASLVTSGPKPFLDVRLDSRFLDLADLGPLVGYVPADAGAESAIVQGTRKAQADRLLPVRSLDMGRIDKLNAHVLIHSRRVERPGGLPFDNFTADYRLNDSQITIDPLQFGFADGALRMRVEMDARGPLKTRVRGSLKGVRLARIFENRRFGEAAGVVSGFVDLRGSGNSVAAMAGQSSGRIGMVLTDGRVPALWPALADLDGMRILATYAKGVNPETVVCTAMDMEVDKGTATPSVGVIETDTTVITMTGSAHLDRETLDLRLQQAPKKPSLLSIRTPLRVRGQMRSPKLSLEPGPLGARAAAGLGLALVNPLLALLATIEPGPGKEGLCPEIGHALRLNRAKGGSSGNDARGDTPRASG